MPRRTRCNVNWHRLVISQFIFQSHVHAQSICGAWHIDTHNTQCAIKKLGGGHIFLYHPPVRASDWWISAYRKIIFYSMLRSKNLQTIQEYISLKKPEFSQMRLRNQTRWHWCKENRIWVKLIQWANYQPLQLNKRTMIEFNKHTMIE